MRNHLFKLQRKGILTFIILYLVSCQSGEIEMKIPSYQAADPSQEVKLASFSPGEGGMNTRLFIKGSNFGTDVSLIDVTVGGQKARIISSNGTEIYCLVPRLAKEGTVEVTIKNPDQSPLSSVKFENKFNYLANTIVTTLCGVVTDRGEHSITDGPLDVAGWNWPTKMIMDTLYGRRDLYVIEEQNCIRKIDLEAETVSTIITKAEGFWSNPKELAWSVDRDTLFICDDQGNELGTGIHFATRESGFRPANPYLIHNNINTVAVHPINGDVFFSYFKTGAFYKAVWDEETQMKIPELMYESQWANTEIGGFYFHPTGEYVYVVVNGRNQIWKADYDPLTRTLGDPRLFAGRQDSGRGYADGVGTEAAFAYPAQGCFVKNPDYAREGKTDVYDFYLTDCDNHCIRKITPDAAVTTYAGRGSWSSDEKVDGYIDGDLRQTARFKNPLGIAYEESTSTFYIADKNNYRIRMIIVE